MIVDKIENAHKYFELSEGIKKGLQYLLENDLAETKNGKYEIEGEKLYVSIQDYETKLQAAGKFEAHKKYTDIQYIIEGKERLGFGNIEDFVANSKYDDEKDIFFLEGNGDFVTAKKGYFVIFTPDDAHMPSICVDKQSYVKKAVVKVAV